MIDLSAPLRTVAGVDLAADAANAADAADAADAAHAANAAGPPRFHVLPARPRVAPGDDGPELSLLRFVRGGELTGGHLHLALDAGHPPERLEEARRALAEELGDDSVELVASTPVSATAELLFLGRETDADGGLGGLVRRGYGRMAAGIAPPHRARFAIDLDPAGVRLMEAALTAGGAPVGVIYRFGFEGLWPALRVVARVDWGRVYDHFSAHGRSGAFLAVEDVQRLREELTEAGAIQIHAVRGLAGETALADPSVALAWIQRELVERCCEPVVPLSRQPARASLGGVGEVLAVGSAYQVKSLTQIERVVAEIDFQRRAVVARTLTAEAHLADLLGGAPLDGHLADADLDHPFFARFALQVQSTRPLADLHLEEAVLRFHYGSHDASAPLDAATGTARFETWADASADGSWSLEPEVRFADDAPIRAGEAIRLPPLAGDSRAVALDLGRLLALRELRLEAPVDPRVLAASARVLHRRGDETRAEREVVLTAEAAAETVWFHDFRPGDRLEVGCRYLTREGRQIDGPPLAADTRVLRLPPPFPGQMTVQLLSDDDWSGLDRVVVTVQKSPDGPAGTFVFTGPGELVPVALDLPDPADRGFRYRVTRTWSSGAVEEDDWAPSDASLVVVGRVASDKLVVDLTPVGPELTAAGVRLIEVELSYLDVENRVRERHTAVLQARADRPRWQIAIADPRRRSYEYRVIVHRITGGREVGPWTASSARILPIPITAAA